MNTCQTSIKVRCIIIVLLKTPSWYYRQHEITTCGSHRTDDCRERQEDKQWSSNMYRRSTTETIMHPIDQNIPVINQISKLQSFRRNHNGDTTSQP